MSGRVSTAALDKAAEIIAAALGVETVQRFAFVMEGDEDDFTGVRLVCALSEGPQVETGYCMGAPKPYEFEHAGAFELLTVQGDEEERRAIIEQALVEAGAAIDADPTLGGLVDHAELEEPDPDLSDRYQALEATLRLTYTARTALG